MAEGTRKFIEDHVLPNSVEKMKSQAFRNERLWTLEVCDLLKANEEGCERIFKYIKQCADSPDLTTLELNDMIFYLVEILGFTGPVNLENIGLAYSLSKQTIVHEMQDFPNYNDMKKIEFYEFLGRFAELTYEEEIPLVRKLERLMGVMFNTTIQ